MSINIALDGPAGAGKSSIAKRVSKELGYIYVDTGALYRTVALYLLKNNIDLSDIDSVIANLNDINIELKFIENEQHVFLNNEDVSLEIRSPEISMAASKVSAIPEVREFLLKLQKDIAANNNIIMDGRDIGTVILPNAQVKIFLSASPEARADRRYKELIEKGTDISYEKVLEEIIERDKNDSTREIAPLKQADDAILIDTSDLNFEQSVHAVVNHIKTKLEQKSVVRKKKNPVKLFFYGILRIVICFIYKIVYNLKYVGKENIPKTGSNVFASNHRSYADPVLVSIPTRVNFSYMAKQELFQKPVFSWFIRMLGAFPVERGKGDTSAIDESMKRINEGYNLLIFPEGTRSKDGTLGKGKTGAALIASKTNAPVIPVAICFKGELKFRKKVIVAFGKPIAPQELQISGASTRDLKALKQRIMGEIQELVDSNVNKL